MATSTVAVGKVKVYSFNEKPLPPGWVLDGSGNPVLDATQAFSILMSGRSGKPAVPDGGGLTPVGGTPELSSHKGYGLGMLAHILGGCLSGSNFSPRDKANEGPTDPRRSATSSWRSTRRSFSLRATSRTTSTRSSTISTASRRPTRKSPCSSPVIPRLKSAPGASHKGIPIPDELARQLQAVCDRAGVDYVLKPAG